MGTNLAADFAAEVLGEIDDKIVLEDMPKLAAKKFKQLLEAIRSRKVPEELAALMELCFCQLAKFMTREAVEAELRSAAGATAFLLQRGHCTPPACFSVACDCSIAPAT